MSSTLNKKSIFKKTAQVSGSTLLSRFLGIAREMIAARYMSPLVRDAFFTAFNIPKFPHPGHQAISSLLSKSVKFIYISLSSLSKR